MSTFEKVACILCGYEAKHRTVFERDAHYYKCPCCGKFWVDSTLYDEWINDNKKEYELIRRQQLASVVIERKFQGYPPPFLADTDEEYPIYRDEKNKEELLGVCIGVDQLIASYPKNGIELFDRILTNISTAPWIGNPMTPIGFPDTSSLLALFATGSDRKTLLQNAVAILSEMKNLNYINIVSPKELPKVLDANDKINEEIQICISTAGWKRLQELKEATQGNICQAFVAMWFDPSRNSYYEGIKEAVENAHLPEYAVKCVRIDHTQHNEKICGKIISSIRQSCYIIADVTGNNGGVYYEAGYAQGIGKPVIWVMDNSYFIDKPMHFDVRQYNTVLYNSPEDLRKNLETRIQATISYNSIAAASKQGQIPLA